MKKINRVLANKDFSKIVKTGIAIRDDSYTVHYLKNDLNKTRIGISVSTKLGNAVVRSRTRRQVRSICDSYIDYQKHSFDIIIVVRNGYFENNFQDNSLILKNILTEIGII